MRIALSSIVRDAGTQVRAALLPAVVADYAQQMQDGAIFPPVVVFFDGTRYLLADGCHRVQAVLTNQGADIDCDVRSGGVLEALWFALGANRTHGVRLSHADKRAAAQLALKTWPERSASAIAAQLGVHQTFVSELKRLRDDDKAALPAKVVGRDGKCYPSNGLLRITTERTRLVEQRLRDGLNVTAVARELHMGIRTVQLIRQEAGLPLMLNRTRAGVVERRERVRMLAAEGWTSRQIASDVGITVKGLSRIVQEHGITIHADAVVPSRLRRFDTNRYLERLVLDAEMLCADAHLLNVSKVDQTRLPSWLTSLKRSREQIGRLIRRLSELHHDETEASNRTSPARGSAQFEGASGEHQRNADAPGADHAAEIQQGAG